MLAPTTRKPYIITKAREKWTTDEHDRFLVAVQRFGRNWKEISEFIGGSRTLAQVRSHAQKHFQKLEKEGGADTVPPARPKKKPGRPYPVQEFSSIRTKRRAAEIARAQADLTRAAVHQHCKVAAESTSSSLLSPQTSLEQLAGFHIKAESECTAEPLPWTSNESIAFQSPDGIGSVELDAVELSTSDEELPSPPVTAWVKPDDTNERRRSTAYDAEQPEDLDHTLYRIMGLCDLPPRSEEGQPCREELIPINGPLPAQHEIGVPQSPFFQAPLLALTPIRLPDPHSIHVELGPAVTTATVQLGAQDAGQLLPSYHSAELRQLFACGTPETASSASVHSSEDYTEVWRLPPLPGADDIWPLPLSPHVSGLALSPRGSGFLLPFTPTSPSLPGAHHFFL